MEEPIAYKNEHGIWIYNRLPEGMRIASKDDFIDINGELILGKRFLIQSFHFKKYEAHITKLNFIEKWGIWLKHNHIFVSI